MSIKQFEKIEIGERLHNRTYTVAFFDVEKGTTYEIYVEQTEETESDIFKMIKMGNGNRVFDEWSYEYDFIKSMIEKYAIKA